MNEAWEVIQIVLAAWCAGWILIVIGAVVVVYIEQKRVPKEQPKPSRYFSSEDILDWIAADIDPNDWGDK